MHVTHPEPGGTHYYGDRCRTGHMPCREIAKFIIARGWSDLDENALWQDIDANPALYLPEFEAMQDARALAAS